MIEDAELRALFQAESEDRIQHLEECLRELEKNPSDKDLLEEALRDAHTIKGSSRMLSIHTIESIAHSLEDSFDKARKDKLILTPAILSLIYEGIDAIQALVYEAINGTPAYINLDALLRKLNLEEKASQETLQLKPVISPAIKEELPVEQAAIPVKESKELPRESEKSKPSPELPSDTEKEQQQADKILPASRTHIRAWERSLSISTIRINVQQINELMTLAADLTVAKNRIDRLFEGIENLLAFWESKNQTLFPFSSFNMLSQCMQLTYRPNIEFEAHLEKQSLGPFLQSVGDNLSRLREDAYEDTHKLDLVISSIVDKVRQLTLVPISKLFDLFLPMVRDLAYDCGKEINFIVDGGGITVDKKIIEEMKDPLMHLLRNAISHGIEPAEERIKLGKPPIGNLQLIAQQTYNTILIEISDDGRGLDVEKIKQAAIQRNLYSAKDLEEMPTEDVYNLIYLSGLSTAAQLTNISGRGIGLDVVQTNVEKLHGTIKVTSVPYNECRFLIQLPITFVTTHVMLVQAGKRTYAIPIDVIERCTLVSFEQFSTVEGQDVIEFENEPLYVASLANLLEPNNTETSLTKNQMQYPCLIIQNANKRMAVLVDMILDDQKIVVTAPNRLLVGTLGFLGSTILKTGKICVVLNPFDFLKTTAQEPKSSLKTLKEKKREYLKAKKTILLVDDSFTTRIILKRLIEGEGYDVVVAEDGLQAWDLINKMEFDAIVSDIEMPKMDGFTLVSNIRFQKNDYDLPVILLTSLSSPENQKKGMDAGASAYLVKSESSQNNLINTLKKFLS